MAKETFSRNLIRMARVQAGMTQAQLAKVGKTSQAAVSAYESGKRSPSVETLTRLIEGTGLELRIRVARPDTHESSRSAAEKLLPSKEIDSHIARERKRVAKHGRGSKT